MKKTRKILVSVLLILAIVSTVFALTACKKGDANQKSVTLIVTATALETTVKGDFGEKTYLEAKEVLIEKEYKTDKAYLKDLIDLAVADKELSFSYQQSYGYVNSYTVGDKDFANNQDANTYVMTYTSVSDINYLMPGFSIVIKDVTYNSNGYGIEKMPLMDGQKYIITYQHINY